MTWGDPVGPDDPSYVRATPAEHYDQGVAIAQKATTTDDPAAAQIAALQVIGQALLGILRLWMEKR